MEVDGSDHFPFQMGDGCRFQPLIFQGVVVFLLTLVTGDMAFPWISPHAELFQQRNVQVFQRWKGARVMLHDWWWLVMNFACLKQEVCQELPCNSDGNYDEHDLGDPQTLELQASPFVLVSFSPFPRVGPKRLPFFMEFKGGSSWKRFCQNKTVCSNFLESQVPYFWGNSCWF